MNSPYNLIILQKKNRPSTQFVIDKWDEILLNILSNYVLYPSGSILDRLVKIPGWNDETTYDCLSINVNSVEMFNQLVLSAILFSFVATAASCSQRGYTPRYEELHSSEKSLKETLAAERKLFFRSETTGRQAISELINQRRLRGIGNEGYLLGPGDQIAIECSDPEELNLTLKIPEDGIINLPVIGEIYPIGISKELLTRHITSRLKRYVRNPRVNIQIKNFASQKVTVVGAVGRPGEIVLDSGANTILTVLGKAGGLSQRASNFIHLIPHEYTQKAFSIPEPTQQEMINSSIEIPTSRIYGTDGQQPLQIPTIGGDVIVVPTLGNVMVDGEVQKPGAFALGQNMTLLGALASAGGITYSADVEAVEIIRNISPTQKAHLIVDLDNVLEGKQRDVDLKSGDVVRVPTHTGRQLARDTYEAISRMIQIGIGGNVNLINNNNNQ